MSARGRRDLRVETARPYARGCDRVCVEDLQIPNTVRNRRLARAVHDASWGAFLGPRIEQGFRRALAISQGEASAFVTRPFSLAILLVAALVLPGPFLPPRGAGAG